ncbi:MAG: flagellar protein [Lachnospiraceae bacterium]|nr:flagellar protein [Lachnospiraceae bacterium]
MEVRNCKDCGRLFNYLSGRPICPACQKKLEEKFAEVKQYIRDNGGATINQIAEANEVDPKQIKQWIREERLVISDDSPINIECESCGAPIKTGRYCAACTANMANNLGSAIKKPKAAPVKQERDTRDRMRFLDKL